MKHLRNKKTLKFFENWCSHFNADKGNNALISIKMEYQDRIIVIGSRTFCKSVLIFVT